jgi:hypothetical protein
MSDETFMDSQFRIDDKDDEYEFIKGLVFIIMSFQSEMDDTYKIIQEECKNLGLDPKRADDIVGSGIILKEITDLIENAEFIICDLTYERPNVYYELGFAHGAGNRAQDILLIAKQGTSLHFDVSSLRVRYYSSDKQLRDMLSRNLTGMIRLRK